MRLKRDPLSHVLVAAFSLFVCRLVLALALIPPWQLPDEPAHVAVAEYFRSRLSSAESSPPGRQDEILQSMANNDWWRHYGLVAPAPVPPTFDLLSANTAVTTLAVGVRSPEHEKPYYTIIALLLSVAPRMPVVVDLYLMRAFSALLGVLTLWVGWRAAREALGDVGGAIVAALLALHPQFVVVATTASPDALIIFFGTCVWWQAMRALRPANWRLPLALTWVAAICAAFTDRMGVPLVASALAICIVVIARHTGLSRATVALSVMVPPIKEAYVVALGFVRAAIGVAVFSAILLGALLLAVDLFLPTVSLAFWSRVKPVPEALTWRFFATFTSVFFESWWFALGWMRYVPPLWWVAVPLALAIGASVGAARRFVREPDARVHMVVGVAMAMLAIQVAAVCWVYFSVAHGPQGRHLFPCLVPTLVLTWLGIDSWVPMPYRQKAAIGLVLSFALLDFTAWVLVAIPAYIS